VKIIKLFSIFLLFFSSCSKKETEMKIEVPDSTIKEFKINFIGKEDMMAASENLNFEEKNKNSIEVFNLYNKIYSKDKKELFELLMNPANLYKLISFLYYLKNIDINAAGGLINSLTQDELNSITYDLEIAKRTYIRNNDISKAIDVWFKEYLDIENDDTKIEVDYTGKVSINSFLDSLASKYGYRNNCQRIKYGDKITTIGNCKKTIISKIKNIE
jgi:hypothetical protein